MGLPIYKWLNVSSREKYINSFKPLESIYQITFFFSATNCTEEVMQLHEVHHLLHSVFDAYVQISASSIAICRLSL